MRSLCFLLVFVVGCSPEQRPDREQVEDVVKKAEKGLRSGYAKAKERLQQVDWQEAYEQTAEKVEELRKSSPEPTRPEPDRWWERADEAVVCKADTCTIKAWFAEAAMLYPNRLRADAKVFTAPEEDGWLLDDIRSGSLTAVLGFKNGDVIQTVAGQLLTKQWARVKALTALTTAKTVMLAYRRGTDIATLRLVFEGR